MSKALLNSTLIHAFFAIFIVSLMFIDTKNIKKTFQFQVIEKEVLRVKKKPNVVINAEKKSETAEKAPKKIRKVFGVKRKTLTSDQGSVEAKVGNTITKKQDDKVLRDDESDTLPAPAEEFLITSMPRALNEIRPEYPKWAKEQKITGSVIFDILIDNEGKVRQANLLKGLHPELDQLAKQAILKFEFKPAFIKDEPTAVRIKYAIKFLLES